MKYKDFIKQYNEEYFSSYGIKKKPYEREFVYYPSILLIKHCLKHFNNNIESVLCLGVAKGYETEIFEMLDKYSVGVDISKYAIRNSNSEANLILGDIRYLPIRDNSFNLIYGSEILEHIPEENIDKIISEIARIGEYCFLTITLKGLEEGYDPTHINIQTRQYWINKFLKYFSVLNTGKLYGWNLFELKRRNVNDKKENRNISLSS